VNKKLKVGIIGCGGIANGKHMPALAKIAEVEMTAFCDIIPERAKKAAEEYGAKGAKAYESYMDMLVKEKLDIVHVLTPNKQHCECSVAALEAGCHVMCEKPMAKTVADAQKMLDAAKKTGKKLTIGYQNRYKSRSLYAKQICEAGDLGDIYFGKAHAIRRRGVPTWGVFLDEENQGGGPLIDIGTHALDLTLWIMNNYKVKRVVGTTFAKLRDQKNTGNLWGDWDTEKFTVEDSAFGFITMENGATIFLEASWALNTLDVKEESTTLCGTKAGLDMNDGGIRVNSIVHGKQSVLKPDLSAGGVAFFEGAGDGTPADIECRQWIDAVLSDTNPTVLPEQAFVVTQILEAIYTSAKTGEPVYFN